MADKPSMPTYDTNLAAQSQNQLRNEANKNLFVNMITGNGSGYKWNPDTNTIETTYGTNDQYRNSLIGAGLANINLNPDEATNKYFDASMEAMRPELDRYVANTNANLVNKGIPIGSQAYNDVIRQQDNNISNIINKTYTESRNKALSDINNQIGSIGSLQGQLYNPNLVAGLGATGLQDFYNNKFQNNMDIFNSKMGTYNSMLGGLTNLGGIAIGSLLSDKRLKENLKPVGKLDNGLTVYIGNYIKDIDDKQIPQLFLIAQEVQEVNPDAVSEIELADGEKYLVLDYAKAVK